MRRLRVSLLVVCLAVLSLPLVAQEPAASPGTEGDVENAGAAQEPAPSPETEGDVENADAAQDPAPSPGTEGDVANAEACCEGKLSFKIESLFLTRAKTAKNRSLVHNDGGFSGWQFGFGSHRTLVDVHDLQDDFGVSLAARLTAGYSICADHEIELSYFGFGLLSWRSREKITRDGNLEVPFYFNTDEFDDANYASVEYLSELNHNAELNWRWSLIGPHEDCAFRGSGLLGGVRYMNIEENLDLVSTDIDSGLYSIETRNHLLGLQLGGNVDWHPCDCLWLELEGKGGGYFNRASQKSVLCDDIPANLILGSYSERETGGAFVGEVALSFHYELFEGVSLFAGYEGLFVVNVALAPDQLYFKAPPGVGGSRRVDSSGTAIYHGGTIGLEARW